MATTIDAAFNEFLNNLRATRVETATAASHRASIEARLQASFGMTSFFRTGSFGNGTNITGYSDVDYFAVIPTTNLKRNSAASLEEVAKALRERFPLTDGIRIDSPGVRVPFGLDGAEATEIVPVDQLSGLTKLG
jgi:tRNA nucleotidyltransferase (CCA-adding enzyme)